MFLDRRYWWLAAWLLALVATVLFYLAWWRPTPVLRVDFLAVGQGDATLIRAPNGQNILIDGGPDAAVLAQVGQRLPWYSRQIDLVVLTHAHDDHVAGLVKLANVYSFKNIVTGYSTGTSPAYRAWETVIAKAGTGIQHWLPGQVLSLGPDCWLQTLGAAQGVSVNNASLVLKLSCQGLCVLFTGDLEEKAERQLAKQWGGQLQSDILKVAHHGSDLGTTPELLAAVQPKVAVISVGKNKFGHPTPRVLKRLERVGAQVYRTDLLGTVQLWATGQAWGLKP
jgi:competence protein ComEC